MLDVFNVKEDTDKIMEHISYIDFKVKSFDTYRKQKIKLAISTIEDELITIIETIND